MKLRPQIATPGESIIVEGDIGDRMFFVSCGKVEILTADAKILRVLARGVSPAGSSFILIKLTLVLNLMCHSSSPQVTSWANSHC